MILQRVEQADWLSNAYLVTDEESGAQPSLKRVMGPVLLLLFIVGDILGTGIYALTGHRDEAIFGKGEGSPPRRSRWRYA